MAFVFLVPIVITVSNSFMDSFEITNRYNIQITPSNIFETITNIHFVNMSFVPDSVTINQYLKLLFDRPLYLGLFWNSIKLTLPVVLGQIIIGVPAAYAFELSKFKYKEAVFLIYVIVMLMPLQVVLVPNYLMADFLHINGTYWAIILPGIFSPFGVFLIRQYLKGMSHEYIEAARMDGAGNFHIFTFVIAPIIKPAIAALSILTFIEYWNMVDQAVIFIKESYQEPLSVYLSRSVTENIDMIFAASCFYMFPTILVFLYGQEYLIEGIQLSGIK